MSRTEGKNGGRRRISTHKTEKRRAIRDEREAVLLALLSHEKNRTFSNVLVTQTLDSCREMSTVERAFIKRLLEGVIERRMELDAVIEQLTKRQVGKLHPVIRQILRMGIYQILYMDAVPDSAACNESVRLAKKHGPARLSGFVNGVLRNAAREEEKRRAERVDEESGRNRNMEISSEREEGAINLINIINLKENSTENFTENSTENFTENSTGNSAENSTENFTESSTGNFAENSTENFTESSSEHFTENSTDCSSDRPMGLKRGSVQQDTADEDIGEWVKSISRKYSSPEWLVRMWREELGREESEKLLSALMDVFPVSARLRCGDSGEDRENLLDSLRKAGVRVEKGRWLPDSIRLRKTSDLRRLPGFSDGLWTVQDESSMLAVEAAGLQGTETVFDVCAAPGGKSFLAADRLASRSGTAGDHPGGRIGNHPEEQSGDVSADSMDLAGDHPGGGFENHPEEQSGDVSTDRMGLAGNAAGNDLLDHEEKNTGKVFSFDLSRKKTDRIRQGAKRLHLRNITVGERDARVFCPEDEGSADVVFCDLPCSGLGVIGKKRDIKYRASLEGIASLQKLQREILANSIRYLKSGGVLIYSTCTICAKENVENAAWIESELGLVPENLDEFLPEGIPGIRGNTLQLLPHVHGTDGFFVARFRKK